MPDYDVLETSSDGNYRVRLVQDDDSDQPGGSGPLILRVENYRYRGCVKVLAGDYGTGEAEAVTRALEYFGGPNRDTFKLFEKWARAYLGTKYIDTWYSDSYRGWYVALDSAAWREMAGVSDDYVRTPGSEGSFLAEWEAWATGDVWGYVVEKRVRELTLTYDPATANELHRTETDAWEEIESSWGFYGYLYAMGEARRALSNSTEVK